MLDWPHVFAAHPPGGIPAMVTRIALDHEYPAGSAEVFAVLSDRAFTERRMALVPEMSARVVEFTAEPTRFDLRVDAHLPASWMPAGLGGTPGITRHERWASSSDGYRGRLRLDVAGLPVECGGELTLLAWQGGSVLSVTLDVAVEVPLVGQAVERMIRDRLEPAFESELHLLAQTVATP